MVSCQHQNPIPQCHSWVFNQGQIKYKNSSCYLNFHCSSHHRKVEKPICIHQKRCFFSAISIHAIKISSTTGQLFDFPVLLCCFPCRSLRLRGPHTLRRNWTYSLTKINKEIRGLCERRRSVANCQEIIACVLRQRQVIVAPTPNYDKTAEKRVSHFNHA